MSEIDKLIELLEITLHEDLDCEFGEALSERIDWDKMPELDGLYGNLFHFWYDEEPRKKDSVYSEMQLVELSKLIGVLKSGDYESANKITFLGPSSNS